MINCTYIHIPFCKTKCFYCSFCSFVSLALKNDYIDALVKEIKFYYKNNYQSTIYFGGGTPSILDICDVERILKCFNYDSNTSITLEANPADLSRAKLIAYKNLGINRISLGAQSFDNDLLKEIGRRHSKSDIYNALDNIKNADFNNFSIDLMYGLPGQTKNIWIDTLKETLKLDIPHISLYGLKLEKGTKFYKFLPKDLPDADIQADMYYLANDMLKEKYIHYEFSNFAENINYISKHNLACWQRKNYYGFGLSASGFFENKRYTNTINIKEYIKNPVDKKYEILSYQQQIEEEIFLGLRLSEGINFDMINKKYNINILKRYGDIFDKYIKTGHMAKTKKGVKLTIKGVELSNEILCEFIEI